MVYDLEVNEFFVFRDVDFYEIKFLFGVTDWIFIMTAVYESCVDGLIEEDFCGSGDSMVKGSADGDILGAVEQRVDVFNDVSVQQVEEVREFNVVVLVV